MLQERRLQHPKPRDELKAEAHAILRYLRLGMPIPSAKIETRLRGLKGIKEVTINYVSHTVKIRYDPSIVTIERIRALLKNEVLEGKT